MAQWKATIISQVGPDLNGQSDIVFDASLGDDVKFEKVLVRSAAGAETTTVQDKLTIFKTDAALFTPLTPGQVITIPE